MKFKLDENLPVEVGDLLRQAGHEALNVMDQNLAGHPDSELATVCRSEERALITLDLDFSDIRSYSPEDHYGIIILRPVLQTITAILRLTSSAISLLDSEPLVGYLWIVDEHQVRIRGGNSRTSP